jgi:6-phosphogluconolactonase
MAPQGHLAAILRRLFLLAATVCGGAHYAFAGHYYLYVGNYTGPNSKGIQAFRYDSDTRAFDSLGMVGEMPRPSFLTLHPNKRFLYAVSELGNDGRSEGFVYAFEIDSATGQLTFLNKQPSGGGGACHLVVDKTAKFLLVANYGTGSVAAFPLQADGRIGALQSKIQFAGSGPNAKRQRGPHAHAVVLSPDNRFLFVPDLGTDRIHILRFDESTGILTPNAPSDAAVAPGAGPRHFTFSPNGRFAYAIDEMGSSVTAFRYDRASGALALIAAFSTLPAGFSGENNSAEIQIDSAGHFLYASNRGDDSIAVFSIDGNNGRLARIQILASGGRTPRNFTIDPTGNYLLVANQDSNNIVLFARSPKNGTLAATGKAVPAPSPVCLLFKSAP